MHVFNALVERAHADPAGVFCHFVTRGTRRAIGQREVVAASFAFAGRMRAAGVGPGDIVPIVLEHRPELYSSFIGCTLIGAVPTLLAPMTRKQDPSVFQRGMQALLARIGPSCIVASARTVAVARLPEIPVLDIDEPAAPPPCDLPASVAASSDDLAFLQHSSGTTGLKKGVCLSHGTVLTQIRAYAEALHLDRRDCIASWLPLYHDMGLIAAFILPAVTGVPFVSMDAMEWVVRPTTLLDEIERHRATLCWMPNFAFHHIARMAEPGRQWDMSSLRMAIGCSEPCRASAFDVFAARFAGSRVRPDMLHTCYAMAEAVFAVAQTEPGTAPRRSRHPVHSDLVSCGGPVGRTRLRIVGPDGDEVPDLAVGGILIRSENLFDGYHKQPDLTAAAIRDGWFATGDLGFRADGEVFVVGRADDVLNINGRKIVANEVEDILNGVAGVAPGRVLVCAEPDGASGATGLVVLAERLDGWAGPDTDIAVALRRGVLACCDLRPSRVVLLERGFLLKSTSGKVGRAASIAKARALGAAPWADT